MTPRALIRLACAASLALTAVALNLSLPHTARAQSTPSPNGLIVTRPNGYANVSATDLVLRSEAGQVRWGRHWDGQEWRFNPQWESLSQSWKNLTGSQSADTTATTATTSGGGASGAGATLSGSGSGGTGGGCWVWVEEDWQPSFGTTVIGGLPQADAVVPSRLTPFNKVMGEDAQNYTPLQRVSVDYASLCAGAAVAMPPANDVEAIRRSNELYLGDNGRYAFSNRSVLEKRPVQLLAPAAADVLYAQLATGRLTLAPSTQEKGYRWIDKSGDWVDHNTQGQVVAHGDRNGNPTWLVRDLGGRLVGVVDARGRVLFSLHYTGALLTEVKDHPIAGMALDLPARSVKYAYDERNRLTQVTDVLGHVTKYAYNVSNRLIQVTDALGRSESIAYTGDTVSRHTAADGAVTDYAFEYDDANKQFISKVTGPQTEAGRRVDDLTHNRAGKPVRQIVNGRTDLEVAYDTGARAEIRTNARGFRTRVVSNEFDQVVRIEHPDGAVEQMAYSPLHLQQTEAIDALGVRTRFEHDARGNLVRKVEAAGLPEQRVTTYQLNARGQAERITREGRTEANGAITPDATWQITWDERGQISQTTDPEGHVRRYEFDRIGSLRRHTDPLGRVRLYEVDAAGRLVKEVDEGGLVRSLSHDAVGNLVAETDGRGKTVTQSHDALNRVIERTNAVGGVRRTPRNGLGLVVSDTDEDGRQRLREHDAFQRLVRLTDGLGHVTTYGHQVSDGSATGLLGSLGQPTEVAHPTYTELRRFDARERLTSRSLVYRHAQGELTGNLTTTRTATHTSTHDQAGRVTSETDAAGQTWRHRYNALGQRTETTDPLGGKTSYLFDARGNVIELTDANGNTHRFEHDRNDRLVRETRPLGQVTQHRHDAAGSLIEKIDPDGTRHLFTLDARTRLRSHEVRVDGTLVRSTSHTWDASNNLTAWSDTDLLRNETTQGTQTWDDANRKLSETLTYPGGHSLSLGLSHSPAGKLRRLTWPDGTQIDYAWSAHGELQGVAIPGEGSLSVNEYNWTAPVRTTLPGGGTQNRAFDGLLQLESLQVKGPGQQNTLELTQRFGPRQELTSRTRTDSQDGASSTRAEQYTHDALKRLTQVLGDASETFALDALDNRLAHSRTPGAWSFDRNNRLTRIGSGDCGSSGVVCFQWNEQGSLVQKTEAGNRVTLYRHDAFNRLREVALRVGGASEVLLARYGHDPMDRRIWKEQYRDASGQPLSPATRTHLLHTDGGLVAQASQDIVLNADGSVTRLGQPRLTAQYGLRPDAPFNTATLFVKARNSRGDDTLAYYHHDQLGTPLQATDKLGNVVWAALYEPFGKASVITPAATDSRPTIVSLLRLPGQLEDPETGLHQNWRRQYDPAVGRYTTADPIGLAGGRNVYAYASADPLNRFDATGEETCGSGWNEPLVPDNPMGFRFSDCCANHDNCYGNCAGPSRSQCDQNFCGCMKSECDRYTLPYLKRRCTPLANLYCGAVVDHGGSAYDAARASCGKPGC